jgi:hypothetical protein
MSSAFTPSSNIRRLRKAIVYQRESTSSHTLNHLPIISRRLLQHPTRIPQDFVMYPLSILHPFGFSIHARISNRKPPLDDRHLCSYQPTTHSPTCDRNVSPVGTRSQAGSQVRTINLKAGCPFMSTVVVLLIVFQIAEQLIRLMTGGPQFSRCSHSPRLPSNSPVFFIHTPILGLCSGSLAHTYSLDTSFMSL